MVKLIVHVGPCSLNLGDEGRVLHKLLGVGRLPAEALAVSAHPARLGAGRQTAGGALEGTNSIHNRLSKAEYLNVVPRACTLARLASENTCWGAPKHCQGHRGGHHQQQQQPHLVMKAS